MKHIKTHIVILCILGIALAITINKIVDNINSANNCRKSIKHDSFIICRKNIHGHSYIVVEGENGVNIIHDVECEIRDINKMDDNIK
jgi:hypothetical protein